MSASQTAVVTGATSGLGEAAAVALGARGWRVVVVGRDEARGRRVVERIDAAGGEGVLQTGDLSTVAGAASLGEALRVVAPRVDLLVNNAGGAFPAGPATADGLERTFAINVLAPHLLVRALMPSLEAAGGRVVNIVTDVPQRSTTTVDAVAGPGATGGMMSYVRNKLALLALTVESQARFGDRGVTFVALHPGVIPETRFGSELSFFFRNLGPTIARWLGWTSTAEQAADRYVAMGSGPVQGAGFYREGQPSPVPPGAADPALRVALWDRLEALAAG